MSFDWLNKDSRTFLSRGYLDEGQSAEDRVREIADTAERFLDVTGFADKFYDYMGRGFYSLSSPVWSNFGNNKGLPISCNGVYVGDEISKILGKSAEVGMQTKHGAGTSGYFGDIRPRGSQIKTGGVADGPVHFMNIFETNTDVISQGNVRRGSFAAYLDIEHPDVEEFLEIREVGHSIQNMSLGLCVSDQFMEEMIAEGEAVKAGELASTDAKKLKLWARVIRKRKESGYPYLFFTDNVNKNKPKVLKDKNRKVYASNLCLRGDTKIDIKVDDEAKTIEIEDFVKLWELGAFDDAVQVLTEKGYQTVSAAAQTGKSKKMIRITSDCGTKTVECTPEHKIFTKNRGWVEAQNLNEDDELDLLSHTETTISNKKVKIEIIQHHEEIPVYDITVPETESFYANGILVHNCSEICLPSADDESFVCNLASMNVLTYDEWKETDAVEVLTYFLDAVMTDYINKTAEIPYMESSYNFAKRWRALGIGQLGWHSYLQSKMIPFESFQAATLATEIARFMDDRTLKASKEMAARYGEPDGMIGYGERNLTRLAIAPTTSSSFILGQVSPSIEPLRSNYFTKDLAKGSFTYKNPYLEKILESYGKNDQETWMSILTNNGSVQHLDFLGETEKSVFATFDEITPMTIVQQAAARQRFIDQSQSLNLMIPPKAPVKDVNALLIEAWKLGVKTLYYQRSANPAQELVRDITACASCEA